MTLAIPPRFVALNGYAENSHTIRGVSISARSGLAYCEIAIGTSGKQKYWRPTALYCPPQTDHAYHPSGHDYRGERWFTAGIISPSPYGFKLIAHRGRNPGHASRVTMHHIDQRELRDLMEHILEKWYG